MKNSQFPKMSSNSPFTNDHKRGAANFAGLVLVAFLCLLICKLAPNSPGNGWSWWTVAAPVWVTLIAAVLLWSAVFTLYSVDQHRSKMNNSKETGAILALKVTYEALGKTHVVHCKVDPENQDPTLIEYLVTKELKKVISTAEIIRTDIITVMPAEYDLNSFEKLVKWNEDLNNRFSHIDNEVIS
jgi:hypothetical protein